MGFRFWYMTELNSTIIIIIFHMLYMKKQTLSHTVQPGAYDYEVFGPNGFSGNLREIKLQKQR